MEDEKEQGEWRMERKRREKRWCVSKEEEEEAC